MNKVSLVPIARSVYEDAPLNYLIDYASLIRTPIGPNAFAELFGLNATGETIFSYRYPTYSCGDDLSLHSAAFRKHEVSDSRTSSAQPLYPGARFRPVTMF